MHIFRECDIKLGIFSSSATTSFSHIYKMNMFLSQRLRLRKMHLLCSSSITNLTSLKLPPFLLPQSFLNCTYIRKKLIFSHSSELFLPTNPLFRQAALRQRVLFPTLTPTFELFVSHLLFVNTLCLVLLMLLAPWKTSSIFFCLHTASKQQEICPCLGSPRNTGIVFSSWGSQLRKLVRGKQ